MRHHILLAFAAILLSSVALAQMEDAAMPARCVEDQRTYSLDADETTIGTISQYSGVGCEAGVPPMLNIIVEPEEPALAAPMPGWRFIFSGNNEEYVAITRSLTVNAMCGSTVMCQATITFTVGPAEAPPTVPPTSSKPAVSTSTPAPVTTKVPEPIHYPACAAAPSTHTYRPGLVYKGTFPMDTQEPECTYAAVITKEPEAGSIAIMPNSRMTYLYTTAGDMQNANVTITYRVHCSRAGGVTVACEGTLPIRVYEEIGPCPKSSMSFYVLPGAELRSTLDTGKHCRDPGAELTASLLGREGEGTLTCNNEAALSFTYVAPAHEAFAAATVRTYCDGEPLCEVKVSILTTAKASTTALPTSTAPPTTQPPQPPVPQCNRTFAYNVSTGRAIRGTLYYPTRPDCTVTTYSLPRNTSTPAGYLDVNIVGDFYYAAPVSEGVDIVSVDVNCVTEFICRTHLYFTRYHPIPDEPTTAPPTPTLPALPSCANVYWYTTAPAVPLSSSLNGKPGQDACAFGRTFTLSAAPQGGSLQFMLSGDFLYTPSLQEGSDEFAFTQFCLGKPYCRGTAYVVVSSRWTLPPSTTAPPSSKPPVVITNPQIKCRGSCVEKAWKTYPNPPRWDNSEGSGNVRKDGRAVDALEVTWSSNALIFNVYAMIGNLGARFPTFEPIVSAPGTFFEPKDFAKSVAATSPAFQMSCLAHQGRVGMGGDVWKWSDVGYATGTGTVGAYYNYGHSWYQKFGGKHEDCDTFADPCRFAPLLTPANSTPEAGMWTIDVDDCDATWRGVFPYASLEKLVGATGQPIWRFVDERVVKGSLISEAVRANSWIRPGRFDAHYTEHDIIVSLNQFVAVTKTGERNSPIAIDTEFYTYRDENGDEAFGINMLVYPYVSSSMKSNYSPDRHVKGFKWVRQSWDAPDATQCPTCTGTKLTCTAEGQYTTATYTGEFPQGDCPAGTSRVELHKGPQMTLADCPANEMFVFNRSGFSASRNCRPTHQNITFRGVVRGSRGLTTVQKRAFYFEGNITLELLMDDDTRDTVELSLSMYVARLSQDTETAEGGLTVCRSGSYWPILDPLGSSVPDRPYELAVAAPTPLCVDVLSTAYGPSDWALFTLNLPNTRPTAITVRSIYVNYNGSRVYLLYRSPATGGAAVPPPSVGAWWQHTQPFLAFRDLSDRAQNKTLSVSAEMMGAGVEENAVYAFTFVPGAVGMDADIEVVVDAAIETENGTAVTTFRRMIHVDPLLTQLSRQGPPPIISVETDSSSRSDLYAIGATAGVAVALFVTAIFFMTADNNRPLPKWVPRGKLITKTVLSVLPANLRSKKKEKRVVHKDMYDAMNSGKY